MHGTVQDPAFVRFVEKVAIESTAIFNTHDWMLLAAASRGERFPKGSESRADRLLDLGLVEKVRGRHFMLSRKYYEFVGQKGAYTRRKGLDREQNLALLQKHIEVNEATGSKLEELCQVLSALPTTQVQSLLRTLQRRKAAHSLGRTKQGRWFPGPAP
jgi:ATP-dependent DNA helicase RecG